MGSKSSSSSGSSGLNIAKWRSYSNNCSCEKEDNQTFDEFNEMKENNQKVKEIRWLVVPIMSTGARVASNIGRGILDTITLGLAEIGFQGKRLSHDALEVKIRCIKCEKSSTYTLEFTDRGSYMSLGEYSCYSPIDGSYYLYPKNMPLKNLRNVYNMFKKESKDYDLVWFNCKHWAKKVYYYIEDNYC